MKCIKHTQDVYEIQDVFVGKEYEFLKYICSNLLEEDWIDLLSYERFMDNFVELNLKVFVNLNRHIHPLFSSHDFIDPSPGLYRETEKTSAGLRCDFEFYANPRLYYTVFWILNDDYDGGEFCYPDGSMVKPKAGSILIHSARESYTIKKVTSSQPKYYFCSFVGGDPDLIYAELNKEKLDTMSSSLL